MPRNEPPLHLRDVSAEQLWADFRRNESKLWHVWDVDFDNGLVPSMLEAAELLDNVEEAGGTIHINLDVELPPSVELDDSEREAILDNGPLIRELLRFYREADYNLRVLAET